MTSLQRKAIQMAKRTLPHLIYKTDEYVLQTEVCKRFVEMSTWTLEECAKKIKFIDLLDTNLRSLILNTGKDEV